MPRKLNALFSLSVYEEHVTILVEQNHLLQPTRHNNMFGKREKQL